jgi:hypothetical protein
VVQGLAGRVDLVVVTPVREGQDLVQPRGEPGRIGWNVHLSALEAGRLREESGLLVEAGPLEDDAALARASQVLGDGASDVGVLDHGLVDLPGAPETQHLATQLGNLEAVPHEV